MLGLYASCCGAARARPTAFDCGRRKPGLPFVRNDSCGYLQTDLTLAHVLARGHGPTAASSLDAGSELELPAPCTHILVTNGDNLYARTLFAHLCAPMRAGTDVIGWYFTSHYEYSRVYVQQGRVERTGAEVLFKARLRKAWIDLGAVMISARILRQQRGDARFTDCGAWREADGRFVERLISHNASHLVLDRILFFHQ